MDEEKLRQAISDGVSTALDKSVREFYVDREKHWEDHMFLGGFRKFIDETKSTAWKVVVRVVAIGVIGLLVLGFF